MLKISPTQYIIKPIVLYLALLTIVPINAEEDSQKEPDNIKETCEIKGNISKGGEKIYHVPGQKYYNVTIISEEKGERWFCTEFEALKAGWRKAKI